MNSFIPININYNLCSIVREYRVLKNINITLHRERKYYFYILNSKQKQFCQLHVTCVHKCTDEQYDGSCQAFKNSGDGKSRLPHPRAHGENMCKFSIET